MMHSIVKLPMLCSIAVAAVAIFSADRMGDFPAVSSFRLPTYTASPTNRVGGELFARPKGKKGKAKNVANNNRNFETIEGTSLPANLKRKVEAKRPPLGHVVPEAAKVKGGKYHRFEQTIYRVSKASLKSFSDSLCYSWWIDESQTSTAGKSSRSRVEQSK